MSTARPIAAIPLIVGYAYLVGRLKALYFAKSFGLPLGSFAPSSVDLLFESWYVLQNAAYFALVCWLAWRLRTLGWLLFATGYAMVPIVAHYSLAEYPHTVMKFVPLLLLPFVWLRYPEHRAGWLRPHAGRWGGGAALFILLVASWGISAAKHFGSYDGRRILAEPERWLQPIAIEWNQGPTEAPRGWFLLDEQVGRLLLLDPGPPARLLRPDMDQIRSWSVEAPRERQPGRQYL